MNFLQDKALEQTLIVLLWENACHTIFLYRKELVEKFF